MFVGSRKKKIGRSDKHSPNRIFDPRTPYMKNIELTAKSKMAAWGPKIADGIWKGVQP